jgi:hypothetical protein
MAPARHSSTKRPPAQRPRGVAGKGAWINFGGKRSSSEWRWGSFGRRVSLVSRLVRPAPAGSGSFGLGPPGFVRHPRLRSVGQFVPVRLAFACLVRPGLARVRSASAASVRLTVRSGAPGIRLAHSAWGGSGSFGVGPPGFVRHLRPGFVCRPLGSGSLGSAFAGRTWRAFTWVRSASVRWQRFEPSPIQPELGLSASSSVRLVGAACGRLRGCGHRRVVILPAAPNLARE